MLAGLIGVKRGMSRFPDSEGKVHAVTVVEVSDNRVVQVKTRDTDGYNAVKLTTVPVKQSRVSRPMAGVFVAADCEAGRFVREFRVEEAALGEYQTGSMFGVSSVSPGQVVDVTGISKGKGFAGVVKRHNFNTQDASHGNSLSHRAPGSIGQNQTPGRVFKGKRMCGHMGSEKVTVLSLKVMHIDEPRQLIFISGAVPGAKGSVLVIRPSKRA